MSVSQSCQDCAKARQGRLWYVYAGSCKGCAARMISRSSAFAACRQSGKLSGAYHQALRHAGVTHQDVKGWI